MPLKQLQMTANVSWSLINSSVTGFAAPTEADSMAFTLTGLNLATFNQSYTTTLTIPTSATITINLQTLTNLAQESFGFGHVIAIMVQPTGANITVGPHSSSGFSWMLAGTTPTIEVNAGGFWAWADNSGGPGYAVSSGAKNLDFVNLSGANQAIVDVTIAGSTT